MQKIENPILVGLHETKSSLVHDNNMEIICILLLLSDNSLISRMPMRDKHFFSEENKKCFKIINDYLTRGKIIDKNIFISEIIREKIPVSKFIISDDLITSRCEFYFNQLSKLSDHRDTANILEKGLLNNSTSSEMIEKLNNISQNDTLNIEYGDKLIDSFLQNLEERKEKPMIIPSGFKVLDLSIGMERGWLITLAARSSIGKSTIAMNMAVNQAKRGLKVIIFTQEMTAIEYLRRIFAYISNKSAYIWKNGLIDEENKIATIEEYNQIKNNLIFVHDGDLDSSHVVNITRAHRPDVVVVDYLQSLGDERGKGETQSALIGSITKKFKILAVQTNSVVIQLSQVNREANNQQNSMPELHHLRDSGNIEQDSDVVLILNRENLEDKEGVLRVAKNRHGKVISIPMGFHGSTFEFYEKHQ